MCSELPVRLDESRRTGTFSGGTPVSLVQFFMILALVLAIVASVVGSVGRVSLFPLAFASFVLAQLIR